MSDIVPVKRALLSVSDKTGLADLGAVLQENGVEILSTGGTARALRESGIKITDVSDYTGFPEMMGGRVKTLHPKIHGGLLALRGDQEHTDAAEAHEIPPIDLLVCNLYPFEETARSNSSYNDCVENMDIGGPAMIRAAAKNHGSVTVLVEPTDYEIFLKEFRLNNGGTTLHLRKSFAAKAYARTAAYDSEIASWFSDELHIKNPNSCLLYTSPSPRDATLSRMPSSA